MKTRTIAIASMALAIGTGGLTSPGRADSFRFEAVTDFPIIDAGDVPYYSEAPGQTALAINSSIVAYRNKFAQARLRFEGNSDFYNIALSSLAELEGEAEYRLLINDVLIGTVSNPSTNVDNRPIEHTFEDVVVPHGAIIAVESLANTNGRIAEGNGTAYAGGRWTSLQLDSRDDGAVAEQVDLALSAAMDSPQVKVGDTVTLTLDISNRQDSAVATGPQLTLTRPRAEIALVSENTLSCRESGNNIICELSEMAAGSTTQLSVSLKALAVSPTALLRASITADQPESKPEDNVLLMPLSIVEGSDHNVGSDLSTGSDHEEGSGLGELQTPSTDGATAADAIELPDSQAPHNEQTQGELPGSASEQTAASNRSGGGSLSPWLFAMLALLLKSKRRIRCSPIHASDYDRYP